MSWFFSYVIFTQGWLSFSDFTAAKELGHLWRCRDCNEDPLLREGGSALGFPFNLAGLCWFQVLAYHLVLQACSIQHVTFFSQVFVSTAMLSMQFPWFYLYSFLQSCATNWIAGLIVVKNNSLFFPFLSFVHDLQLGTVKRQQGNKYSVGIFLMEKIGYNAKTGWWNYNHEKRETHLAVLKWLNLAG